MVVQLLIRWGEMGCVVAGEGWWRCLLGLHVALVT